MIPRSDEEAEAQGLDTLSQATQPGTAERGLEPGHLDCGSGAFSSALLRGSEGQAVSRPAVPRAWPLDQLPQHLWGTCHGHKFLAPPRLTELGCSSLCLNKALWFGCMLTWEDPLFCK